MKKWKKVTLIVAVVCLTAGLLVAGAAALRMGDLYRNQGYVFEPGRQQNGLSLSNGNGAGTPSTEPDKGTTQGVTPPENTTPSAGDTTQTVHTYSPEGAFSRIRVNVEDAHIFLLPAADGQCRVEYTQSQENPLSLTLEQNTLQIKQPHDWSFWNPAEWFVTPEVRIYLPETLIASLWIQNASGSVELAGGLTFSTVQVETTSGKILCQASVEGEMELDSTSGSVVAENLTAGSLSAESTSGSVTITAATVERELELDSTSGKIMVKDVTSGSAELDSTSGKIELTSLLCRGSLEVESTSGGIRLDYCDAGNLSLETTSGTIRGSLLTPKQFRTSTVSGIVEVPASSGTGVFYAETVSGGIHITVETPA